MVFMLNVFFTPKTVSITVQNGHVYMEMLIIYIYRENVQTVLAIAENTKRRL